MYGMVNTMLPGIYDLRYDKLTDNYYLIYLTHMFHTPPKLYGDSRKKLNHIWNNFVKNGFKGGVILTGQLGSGKTEIGKIISNNAVSNGMYVVRINKVPFKPHLYLFLDSLDNVVLFFDEFGKTFRLIDQESMLNLLSNTIGKKRIVVITENKKEMLSGLIRNRPGRLKYAIHYNKLPISTLLEYCEDKNVNKDFLKQLTTLYKKLVVFSFDHLKAIVEEHLDYPKLSLEEIIDILNLDMITGDKELILKEVLSDNPTEVITKWTGGIKKLNEFENGYTIWVALNINSNTPNNNPVNDDLFSNNRNTKDIYITTDDVLEITDTSMLAKKDGYTLEFTIIENTKLKNKSE